MGKLEGEVEVDVERSRKGTLRVPWISRMARPRGVDRRGGRGVGVGVVMGRLEGWREVGGWSRMEGIVW